MSAGTAEALDVLRRHRHWLRHAYAAGFDRPRMEEAAHVLPAAVAGARGALDRILEVVREARTTGAPQQGTADDA